MPTRIVLDTNAWLDLLVFADPRIAPVAAAQRAGRVEFLLAARTRDELARVLAYPVLSLDPARIGEVLAGAESRSRRCSDPPSAAAPRCRDPDDQVFLDLAVAEAAGWLLTRDAELLRLAPRMRDRHAVEIAPPEAWRDRGAAPQISKR